MITEPISRRIPLPQRRVTARLGRTLGPLLRPSDLVLLEGPLGAGKTFFARMVARGLGLPAEVPVTSPTFALVSEYETTPPLAHADLYRLESDRAVRELGLDARRDDGFVLLVEWGARFADVLGGDALLVELSVEPRALTLDATGPRSRDLLVRLEAAAPVASGSARRSRQGGPHGR